MGSPHTFPWSSARCVLSRGPLGAVPLVMFRNLGSSRISQSPYRWNGIPYIWHLLALHESGSLAAARASGGCADPGTHLTHAGRQLHCIDCQMSPKRAQKTQDIWPRGPASAKALRAVLLPSASNYGREDCRTADAVPSAACHAATSVCRSRCSPLLLDTGGFIVRVLVPRQSKPVQHGWMLDGMGWGWGWDGMGSETWDAAEDGIWPRRSLHRFHSTAFHAGCWRRPAVSPSRIAAASGTDVLGALDLILTRVVRGAIGHGSPALPSQSRYWPGTTRLLCSDGVLQALWHGVDGVRTATHGCSRAQLALMGLAPCCCLPVSLAAGLGPSALWRWAWHTNFAIRSIAPVWAIQPSKTGPGGVPGDFARVWCGCGCCCLGWVSSVGVPACVVCASRAPAAYLGSALFSLLQPPLRTDETVGDVSISTAQLPNSSTLAEATTSAESNNCIRNSMLQSTLSPRPSPSRPPQ